MFKSDRDIPLICQGVHNCPVITVENYIKWYTLYVIHPDERVESLCYPGFENHLDEPQGEMGFHDHCPNPRAVCKMAERLGYDVDEVSLDAITGRWHIEVENFDPNDNW